MKYKIFLLTICLFLLSACNVTYNIEINKDKSSNEILTIDNFENYYDKSKIETILLDNFPNMTNLTHEIKDNNLIIKRKSEKYYDLSHNYAFSKQFGVLEADLNKISFKPNYDKCIFLFLDGGEYVKDDKIEINLTLPFKISNSNADKVNGNTYTWVYSINDCQKEINIEFYKSNILNYIIALVGVFIVVVCIIVIKRRKLK